MNFLSRNLSKIDIVSATVLLLDCKYHGVGTFVYLMFVDSKSFLLKRGPLTAIVSTISAVSLIGLDREYLYGSIMTTLYIMNFIKCKMGLWYVQEVANAKDCLLCRVNSKQNFGANSKSDNCVCVCRKCARPKIDCFVCSFKGYRTHNAISSILLLLICLQIIHASIRSLLATTYFDKLNHLNLNDLNELLYKPSSMDDIEKFTEQQLLSLVLLCLNYAINVISYLYLHRLLLSVAIILFLYAIYRDIHKLPLTLNSRFPWISTSEGNSKPTANLVEISLYEIREDLKDQQKKSDKKQESVIEELKKIQKQFQELKQLQLQQDIESKKQHEEIQMTVTNQTKQQNLLQNLVLDLKNCKSNQKAEKVEPETSDKCVICLDKPFTHALRPCGHLIACTDCAKKLPKECPICRRTISDTLKIFFP